MKFSRKQSDKVNDVKFIEISRDKNIVDSTWGLIKDFFKMNQASKYTAVIEEIKKEKQPFEHLSTKTNEILTLIND